VEDRAWTYAPAFAKVGEFMQSLKDYPPRMRSADFNIDEAMRALTPSGGR
jgi:arylsulfatase